MGDEDGETTTLPSHVLYDTEHFQKLHHLLKENEGCFMMQAETYNIPSNLSEIRKWKTMLQNVGFGMPRYGSISISSYPTGQIGFLVAHVKAPDEAVSESNSCGENCELRMEDQLCSENDDRSIEDEFKKLEGKTKYYNPRIHKSSYALPAWV